MAQGTFEPIAKIAAEFARLPGIGQKSALRLAYFLADMPVDDVHRFASNVYTSRKEIHFCPECGNFSDGELCRICNDQARHNGQLCVVKEPRDVATMERMRDFKGRYHVLNGTLSPMNGIGPDDIRIAELLERVRSGSFHEVILATNPDIEGEATANYIAQLLKPMNVRVTRIAHGVPVGLDIEYADEVTLAKALEGRRDM